MTEAEALAIAVKAIVSAFVTEVPVEPTRRPKPKRATRRAPRSAEAHPSMEELPFVPMFGNIGVGDFEPPEVDVAELERLLNSKDTIPTGYYDPNDPERDGPRWPGQP